MSNIIYILCASAAAIYLVYEYCNGANYDFRILWIFGGNKTNGNVRTLEELLPNRDQDGYRLNPIAAADSDDTFIVDTVSYDDTYLRMNYYYKCVLFVVSW